MYKDVKKKILAVVLCICMVIGAVEIVPRVQAAASTVEVNGTVENSDSPQRTFTVTLTLPENVTYDGKEHAPTLNSVSISGISELKTTSFSLRTEPANPVDEGDYEVYLVSENTEYKITETKSLGKYTIGRAVLNKVEFIWDRQTVAITNSQEGAAPTFSSAKLKIGNTGNTSISLTSEQYTVGKVTSVGEDQICKVTIADEVKKNFIDNNNLFDNIEVTCNAAYDLSNNDLYYVAFCGDNNEPLQTSSAAYADGISIQPRLGIFDKSDNFITSVSDSDFNISPASVTDPGSYSITVTPPDGEDAITTVTANGQNISFTGSYTGTFNVTGKSTSGLHVYVKNPAGGENLDLADSNTKLVLTYNGGASVIPNVETIQDDSGKSLQGQYTVSPGENTTGVGTATIKITFDPSTKYEGELELKYTITSGLKIGTITFPKYDDYAETALDFEMFYTGQALLASDIEVYNMVGKKLDKGEQNHYVVTYNYQDGAGNWALPQTQEGELSEDAAASDPNMAKPGEKLITVWGVGTYKGQHQSKKYNIATVKFEEHPTWFEVSLNKDSFYYNGQEQKPIATLKYQSDKMDSQIELSSDIYTLTYSNNVNVTTPQSKATVTIKAKNNSGFSGTIEKEFTIKSLDLSNAELKESSYVYTGSPVQPQFVISGAPYGDDFEYVLDAQKDYIIVNSDGTRFTGQLPVNVDENNNSYDIYIQVKSENKNVISNESGPFHFTYQIIPKDIESVGFTLQGVNDGKIEWKGTDTKPGIISVLEEITDYTAVYENYQSVSITTKAAVKITGTGNYTGNTTITYEITPRSLATQDENGKEVITITPKVSGDLGNFTIELTVKDNGEGVGKPTLVQNIDYEIKTIKYLTDESVNYSPTDLSGLTKAGEYEITLGGINNYKDTKTVIVGCGTDISNATLTLSKTLFTYNGSEQKPTANLRLPNSNDPLNSDCYTISYSRADGISGDLTTINAGTITVIATGNPDNGYFGTTTAEYTIQQLNIRNVCEIVVTDQDCLSDPVNGYPAFTYSGRQIKPDFEVRDKNTNNVLEYSIDYENIVYGREGDTCKDVGFHYITVTGTGNYTGELDQLYWIAQLSMTSPLIQPKWDNALSGTPTLKLYLSTTGEELVEGDDYTKSSIKWKQGDGATWENTCYYTVTGSKNFIDTIDFEYEIQNKIVLTEAKDNSNPQPGETWISYQLSSVLVDPDNLEQKQPSYQLYYRSAEGKNIPLTEGTDYEFVKYGENKMPGTTGNYVEVKGKGRYDGNPIFPLTLYTDINKATFTTGTGDNGEGGSVLYDGAKITVKQLTEAIENETLSELVTFDEMWKGDGNIDPSNYTVKLTNPNASLQIGHTVKLTIEGTKQPERYYAGTRNIDITLTGAINNKDQIKVEIGNNNTVPWEGVTVLPFEGKANVVVTDNGEELTGGVITTGGAIDPEWDYTVSFSSGNTGIGVATATIKGVNNYSGTITQKFKITYQMSELQIKMFLDDGTDTIYNDQPLKYRYNTSVEKNKKVPTLYYQWADGSWHVVNSRYYSLTYNGYDKAGDAWVTVGAPVNEDDQGVLIGTKKIDYILERISMSEVGIRLVNGTPTFTGAEIKAEDIGLSLVYSVDGADYELTAEDYKLTYENNINATKDGEWAKVIITGQGNFTDVEEQTFQIKRMPLTSDSIELTVKDLIYTGDVLEPEFTLKQKSAVEHTLQLGTDYVINYYLDASKKPQNTPFKNVGSYYVEVEGINNYTSTLEIPYEIVVRQMEDGIEVKFVDSENCPLVDGMPYCVYNGKKHEPAVQVIYNGKTLVANDDYGVEYSENVNAGDVTVTVTGKDSFAGTKQLTFKIQPKNIAGEDMTYRDKDGNIFADEQEFAWQVDTPVKPDVLVYDGSLLKNLGADDYEIIYTDNNEDGNNQINAGMVTLTVTGTGNYGGTKEFTYYIGEDISKSYAQVNGKNSVSVDYNGLAQAPDESAITVVSNGVTLTDDNGDKRYDIAYYKDGFSSSNLVTRDQMVDAGTYYVAIVGVPTKGTYAKSGISNSCIYEIKPRSISPSYILVSGYDGSYYYTGLEIQPKGIVVEDSDLPRSNDPNDPSRRTVRLEIGKDYEVSYKNNQSAGEASIIITGKGNYDGTREAYFSIVSTDVTGNNTWDGNSEGTGSLVSGTSTISATDIRLGYDNSTYNYMLYTGYAVKPTVSINGVSSNDFIVTAQNNVQPGIATLYIDGTGKNYTGRITMYFEIKADLSKYGKVVDIADQVYTGNQITPNVTVTCGGNILTQGKDFTVTYANNTNVGTATVIAYAASDSYYVGSVRGSFNISNAAGGMQVTGYASSYTYSGYAITPDIVVTMNGRVLTRGTDYTVSYSNNINVGTATMTVRGIGSYSGTQTINFTIEAKNIENCLATAVTSYQYTGNTYTPNVTVTDSSTGKTLVAGTDYTITYSNNTNPGTASITVTALSKNYTGTKVIPFKITSAAVSGLRTSTIKNNSIKLAWSAQDYADGYQIVNSKNQVVATTSKNSYTVKGLTSYTTYKFKVRSYVENADGSVSYGSFSTAVSARTLLNTPTLKVKSTSKGKVTLTWTKISKATGYEIYYSTKKNGVYTRLKTISKSSTRKYVDSGLASGEKYYYTIRAYRTANGVKTYSSYNTIKSVKVK